MKTTLERVVVVVGRGGGGDLSSRNLLQQLIHSLSFLMFQLLLVFRPPNLVHNLVVFIDLVAYE